MQRKQSFADGHRALGLGFIAVIELSTPHQWQPPVFKVLQTLSTLKWLPMTND